MNANRLTKPKGTALVMALVFALALMACETSQPQPTPTPVAAKGEHPGYAPGKTGEVRTVVVNGKTFQYEVIDGLAIYQGDMILGPAAQVVKQLAFVSSQAEQQAQKTSSGWTKLQASSNAGSNLKPQSIVCDSANIATGFGWFCGRWPDGIVPYSFQNDWGSEANNATQRSVILQAMNHWSQRTNLRFREVAGSERMLFRNSDGCSSYVGRQENIFDEPQAVNLNFGGCGVGQAIHEIGHALGLFHEQSRADRDSFVRINGANIAAGESSNFGIDAAMGNDVGAYDFASTMHYSCGDFSGNGLPTIDILTPGVTCAGVGRLQVSDGDILGVYTMYPLAFEITNIAAGASFSRNGSLFPKATFAVRPPFKPEFIRWTRTGSSSTLGTGTDLSVNTLNFPVGPVTLTATLNVFGVNVASRSVSINMTNVLPNASVQQPANGTSFCANEAIPFRALVSDIDGTVANNDIVWSTTSNPALGTGLTINPSFASGPQTVTVRATDDSGGATTASVTINITTCVLPSPVVNITNPSGDISVIDTANDANGGYLEITLAGNASVSGTPITGANLVWTTDRADLQPGGPTTGSQQLGTGASLPVRLYTDFCANSSANSGRHIITLTATSAAGVSRFVTRRIVVQQLC
jgi:Astacin (Peptidase family M12A)